MEAEGAGQAEQPGLNWTPYLTPEHQGGEAGEPQEQKARRRRELPWAGVALERQVVCHCKLPVVAAAP